MPEYTREITCPHCNYEFSDSWEYVDFCETEVCPNCDEEFTFERHVEVTYSSYVK